MRAPDFGAMDGMFLSMPDVLSALPAEAASLQWCIVDIGEVVPDDGHALGVLELDKRVLASPTGLALSFAELSGFARRT